MAHFLVISFPMHGSINPMFEFARRLARAGAQVTFSTSVSAYRRIIESLPPEEGLLSYASFSDGHDDGFNSSVSNDSTKVTVQRPPKDGPDFFVQFREAGARKASELVRAFADEGRPVTCLVYSMLQTWASDVAHELRIPAVVLWIQPAAVLAIYYHYFNGCDRLMEKFETDPEFVLELPNLPPLAAKDVPSFLLPSDPHSDIRSELKKQLRILDREAQEGKPKPRVLVNTFEALEGEALRSVHGLNLICIGPLISSKPKNPSSVKSNYYMEWLDSRPISSVVYVSFGSIINPCNLQMEEILNGLLETRRPFLWAIKGSDTGSDYREIRTRVDGYGEGLVVGWCSQVEVLRHPSTGCFLTHCGWNSTSESLAMGVPMVCFPQWTDQMTNAKLVEDVWKTGVRVKVNDEGVLEGGELKRCLEEVMGGEEIKKNASKWRDLCREAAGEGGSSDRNIREFVEEMGGVC